MNVFLTFPDCHRRGGVERIMVECANFLAKRDHRVTVVAATCDAGVLHAKAALEPVAVLPQGTVSRLRGFRELASTRLAQLVSDLRPESSVHAAFGVTSPPGGVLWVQSVHAEWLRLSRASRGFVGRLKQRLNPFHPYILKLEREYYGARTYRRLIALTPRVKAELMEHYAVPADDIDILPNGYNPDDFNPQRRINERGAVRAELGYRADDRVLLFVANELERKGFFPLVEALARLKEPQVKLLVVGRVDLQPHQALLTRLGVAAQVRCIGPSADVGRFFAAADLFVLPTYYEAWGLVIVEALATGVPVLTSRLAGASVAVQDGCGRLLENPKDPAEIAGALQAMLREPSADAERISQSVAAYRWATLLQTYENILARHVA